MGRRHIFSILSLLILSGVIFAANVSAAGELDPSFTALISGATNGSVLVIKQQPDGKILIGGSFTDVNGTAANGLARLNADGTVDTSFNPPVFYSSAVGGTILAIGLQSNGKILVGGQFNGAGTDFGSHVRRLNQDGTLDLTFTRTDGWYVSDLEVLPDDKFIAVSTSAGGGIRKYNANGSVDTTFTANSNPGSPINEIEIQPDGKIVIGAGPINNNMGFLWRYNPDGSVDTGFAQHNFINHSVEAVKILPDGKILIGGTFTVVNGFAQGNIARFNPDGSIDLTFNQNNTGAAGQSLGIRDIALQTDGKILIGGSFSSYNGVARQSLTRLNADGTLDSSFQNNATAGQTYIFDIEQLPNGQILLGVQTVLTVTPTDPLLRLNADGSSDTSLFIKIKRGGRVYRMLQQPDGKILIAGEFSYVQGVPRQSLARLNADGSLDASFNPDFNGTFPLPPLLMVLALQPDGKIIVGGQGIFRRLNPDGSRDTGFVNGSTVGVSDIVVLPGGKFLVGGGSGNNGPIVQRLNPDGSLDSTFNTTGVGAIRKILVQPDGKILIGGTFTQVNGVGRGRIARLNADGSLDDSFNPIGGANDEITDLDLQTDGKIVVVGAFTSLNGSTTQAIHIGRLNPDGNRDATFTQRTDGTLFAVKVLPNGKILIGGAMTTVGASFRASLAQLNENGSQDFSFVGTTSTLVYEIVLQADGKILAGGEFTKANGVSKVRVARFFNATVPQAKLFDYDGDGKADISVFRPSENKWYILRSFDGQVIQTIFAVNGDVPAPADFDGDGKTDISIYRPSAGDWWSLSSQNGQQMFADWGQPGVIARPSDFDGDGKSDYIFYLPSNSTWYRYGSSAGASYVQFGLSGDKPITGDFDGDGKSDVAIYRPSTGDWWWKSSIDGAQRATHWGISTDIPAPADYDGDGKTDFAVYRPSNGTWYVYNSSTLTSTILNFGLSEDKPVPADYDGDGKADIAVFRPSTGVWYLMRSSQGFAAAQFGISSDIPTPNAYIQ